MNPFEVPTMSHVAQRKLTALIADGYQVCGVAIAREHEDGKLTRGAVSVGGMVLWWPTPPTPMEVLAEQRQTEVLRWVNITPETMPDANELVLIEREDDGVNEPTWPGYWDGEQWCDVDGDLFPGKPISWCSWPGGRKGVRP